MCYANKLYLFRAPEVRHVSRKFKILQTEPHRGDM